MNIKHRLQQHDTNTVAIIENNVSYTYGALLKNMAIFRRERWKQGSLVSITAKSKLLNIAKLFQVIDSACIAVPMVELRAPKLWQVESRLYDDIKRRQVPGLVLFTSGSSGSPKVAVHDASKLLKKWEIYDDLNWQPKPRKIYLCMLDFDHIGGINTIFHVLFNGGTLVFPDSRDVDDVVFALANHRVNILPTSPSFLKMFAMRTNLPLANLEMITYGTEPMPQATLDALRHHWPHVTLKQTYGLTELGIVSTKSKSDGELWIKLSDNGFKHRIVDGILQIKAASSMLGYVNAPSPFTDDGYYNTGDRVETDGEWLKIIGRITDFINVGGNKVCPVEIESDVMKIENIEDCTVEGEENAILGQVIRLTVKPHRVADDSAKIIRANIIEELTKMGYPRWKIPQKIVITDKKLYSNRLKKVRENVQV